eukprot:TRINITY_DN2425_c0_g1_i1.p1 TRINITY_DN2425_c0_g1~~TRINITY_DN2425_c0_g1_i1.p1  ORF type:complete len:339 (+),score=92.26 TRINITY_DN2425_c0_g1_i1:38-1054(+)
MAGAKVHFQTKLALNADSCEFCPVQPNLFAAGCYQLNTATQIREGMIHLMKVTKDETVKVEQACQVEVPGIFDMKWFGNKLAIASATGKVDTFELKKEEKEKEEEKWQLLPSLSSEQPEDSPFSLAVGWAPDGTLASSYSSGDLRVFEDGSEFLTPKWEKERAHDNEAWTVCFHSEDSNLLYSGADDCKLKAWDIRRDPSYPLWVNKQYSAGVTTIETNKKWPNYVFVGSYDETVNVWDIRKPTSSLSSVSLGGGIWRIRSSPYDNYLAVAAMRGYFHLLEFEGEELKIVATHDKLHESESLSYGIDRMPVEGQQLEEQVLASVSFYDNLLSVWSPQF